jgi:hypothetical protein
MKKLSLHEIEVSTFAAGPILGTPEAPFAVAAADLGTGTLDGYLTQFCTEGGSPC